MVSTLTDRLDGGNADADEHMVRAFLLLLCIVSMLCGTVVADR